MIVQRSYFPTRHNRFLLHRRFCCFSKEQEYLCREEKVLLYLSWPCWSCTTVSWPSWSLPSWTWPSCAAASRAHRLDPFPSCSGPSRTVLAGCCVCTCLAGIGLPLAYTLFLLPSMLLLLLMLYLLLFVVRIVVCCCFSCFACLVVVVVLWCVLGGWCLCHWAC